MTDKNSGDIFNFFTMILQYRCKDAADTLSSGDTSAQHRIRQV